MPSLWLASPVSGRPNVFIESPEFVMVRNLKDEVVHNQVNRISSTWSEKGWVTFIKL